MTKALLPGSYDPITLGHLDIIKRAAALYDEVVVAVMNNDAKTYMFSMAERAEMAGLAVADLANVTVIADSGLLIDLFDRLGADVIVKGIRDSKDRAYEEKMAAWNIAHNPRAATVYMQSADDFAHISSTVVREKYGAGDALDDMLPFAVAAYIKKHGVRM